MWDILTYLLLIVLLAAAVIGFAIVWRSWRDGTSPFDRLFGLPAERRLDVVEHHSLDGRRRLVLVRRDDVEHLILTGGPVDVVIETGIGGRASAARGVRAEPVEPAAPIFSRPSRSFGQAGAAEK